MNFRHLIATALFFCAFAPLHAQKISTPAAGTPVRKAIMDALRVPAERDLGQPVIFKVQHLRVGGGWAFARVEPLQPNGRAIDYSRTKYAEDDAEGVFDGEGEALLRGSGQDWEVVEWRFGATDTEVQLWLEKYRFPRALCF